MCVCVCGGCLARPHLRANLVAALASLQVDNLTHGRHTARSRGKEERGPSLFPVTESAAEPARGYFYTGAARVIAHASIALNRTQMETISLVMLQSHVNRTLMETISLQWQCVSSYPATCQIHDADSVQFGVHTKFCGQQVICQLQQYLTIHSLSQEDLTVLWQVQSSQNSYHLHTATTCMTLS